MALPRNDSTQRILDLFEDLWPTERWHLRFDRSTETASIEIWSQDRTTTYARVFCSHTLGRVQNSGFEINVSYPAFSGTVEQMDDYASVIAALGPVVRKMMTTALIQKGS